MGRSLVAVSLLLGFTLGSSCSDVTTTVVELNTQGEGAGAFDAALAAVTKAGLGPTIDTLDSLTLFLPTDDAFAAAGLCAPAEVTEGCDDISALDSAVLTNVLLYHASADSLKAEEVVGSTVQTLLEGRTFDVSEDGVITDAVGETATIVDTDIDTCNGYVHIIDSVLATPPQTEAPTEQTEAPMDETEAPIEETEAPTEACVDLVSLVVGANEGGDFDCLIDAVTTAGLVETLATADELTVFAPTDAAFAAAGFCAAAEATEDCIDVTTVDVETLMPILTYHVAAGTVPAAEVLGTTVTTLNGGTFEVSEDAIITDSTGATINIVTTDLYACNGVAHVIDGVLMPPRVTEEETEAPMEETEAPMEGTEAPMEDTEASMEETEAPTEEEEMTDGEMESESEEMTDGDMESEDESMEDNGAEDDGTEAPTEACVDLVSLVVGANEGGDFDCLIDAVTTAGLVETLATADELTVFAPTDAAFAAAGFCAAAEATEDCIDVTTVDVETLMPILTYHVAAGTVPAAEVLGTTVTTLNGGTFEVSEDAIITDSTGATINIVTTDLYACNGVAHVIDGVLTPPAGGTDAPRGTDTEEEEEEEEEEMTDGEMESEDESMEMTDGEMESEDESVEMTDGEMESEDESMEDNGAEEDGEEDSEDCVDLVSLVVGANDGGDFDCLIDAITSVDGLAETISTADELTVFAPTDAAFAAAGLCAAAEATEDCLDVTTVDEPTLANILTYHVTAGTVPAAEVLNSTVTALNGDTFDVSADAVITDGTGNTANIVATDLYACNGVAHVIDSVLMPPPTLGTEPPADTSAPTEPAPVEGGGMFCSDQCSEAAPCYNDPMCSTDGGLGCNAHGAGQDCRFCGKGEWMPCDSIIPTDGGDAPTDDSPACNPSAEMSAMLLQGFDKSIFADPSCLGDAPGLLCNYMGLGQECRGCWLTCEGAAAGMVTYPEFNPENIVFCPLSGLSDYASDC